MPESSFERIRELFDALVELPVAEREALLAREADDAPVRDQVRRLLAAHDVRTSRATRFADGLPGLVAQSAAPEVGVGSTLGAWTLIDTLGAGGMGAVFLADRRDGHYDQRAAVKVLHGVPSAAALALLAAERQILASLSHPHIARLLDGGATPRGQPYLVMEYVEGVALDAHVRDAQLSRAATLRLFLQVCAAVSFAHARLVVHCDLKPSNVLIDAAGRPVLLDFGIARLLGRSADEPAPRAYTPRYASPELVAGEPVGTAADVYSLGVVLGELIDGRSQRDLDAIVAKARAAAPAERYASVGLLAADVERWLEQRPVAARAPSLVYTTAKLLRRRWPAFAAATAFTATVLIFGWQLAGQRNRALEAEAAARREAEAAQAVAGFLGGLFRGVDVDEGGARETKALALVDRGRVRIAGELGAAPATQAELTTVLAGVYASLGEPQQAATLYTRALDLERSLRPARAAKLARLLIDYSALELLRNRAAEAEPLAREALKLAEAAPERPRELIDALSALAAVQAQLAHAEDAEARLKRALALRQAEHDPDWALAETWYQLAQNAVERGDLDTALARLTPALAALRAHYGESHPRTLDAAEGLAVVYGRQERLAEAEALLRDALARRLAIHGERSSKVASVQGELAYLLTQKGQYVESAALNEQVLAHDAAVQGRESPVYARTLNNLAFAYQNMGDADRCVAAFEESLAIRIKTLPAGDLAIARAQNNLARFLTWLGRTREARPLVESALAARIAQLPEDHEERLESEVGMMELARRAGDLAGAHARWTAHIEPFVAKVHPYTQLEAARMRAWLAASERDPETPRYVNAYIDGLIAKLGASNPSILRGRVAQAEMLEVFGDHRAAVALARELQAQFKALPAAYPPQSVFHARVAAIAAREGP